MTLSFTTPRRFYPGALSILLDLLTEVATLQQDGKEHEFSNQQEAAVRRYGAIYATVLSQSNPVHPCVATCR
jgi:hypothetical protein